MLPFYVLIFWPRGMWNLSYLTRSWTQPPPPHLTLEGEVLTTGPLRKWFLPFPQKSVFLKVLIKAKCGSRSYLVLSVTCSLDDLLHSWALKCQPLWLQLSNPSPGSLFGASLGPNYLLETFTWVPHVNIKHSMSPNKCEFFLPMCLFSCDLWQKLAAPRWPILCVFLDIGLHPHVHIQLATQCWDYCL